jgi:hypothetical protein
MPSFALDDSLAVNIFRTEEHLIDAAGFTGPLWGQNTQSEQRGSVCATCGQQGGSDSNAHVTRVLGVVLARMMQLSVSST